MYTYTFHVTGTHCASCKILLEDVLGEQAGVNSIKVDLQSETVAIETSSQLPPVELAEILSRQVKAHGYTLSITKSAAAAGSSTDALWTAVPLGLAMLALFFLLQRSGALQFGIGGRVTPLTGFLIGLIASVSSCLAIVGGLVLSLSAKVSQDDVSDTKTFYLFHGGRLVSFALLGGALGAIGDVIGISFTFTAILGLVAAVVMVMLGFNLLGIMAKNRFTLPARLFTLFKKIEHKTFTPLAIGFGTFFLPCGFTQSMQVAALASGSFWSGLLIMLAFALGTLPMLALLSFGSTSFAHSKYAPVFFKTAGVVVIGLGLFALLGGLAGLGIINPLFNL